MQDDGNARSVARGGKSVSEVALQGAARVRSMPAGAADRLSPAPPIPIVTGVPLQAAKDWALVVLELAGLWGLNKLGYLIVARLHVPLPGNVAGMLVLFALLCAGIVPERLFQRSSTLLARHLPFFFVPIAVGLMNMAGTFMSQGWVLLLVLIASAAAGLCATGWVAQLLSRLKRQR